MEGIKRKHFAVFLIIYIFKSISDMPARHSLRSKGNEAKGREKKTQTRSIIFARNQVNCVREFCI